jgi:hypothetical protein
VDVRKLNLSFVKTNWHLLLTARDGTWSIAPPAVDYKSSGAPLRRQKLN